MNNNFLSACYAELENKIGYKFQNAALLETALTHSSYANEQDEDIESNERLEFLGDAVMGVEIAILMFEAAAHLSEGQMTTARASLVRSEGLAGMARQIGLGECLRLGVGAERTGVRDSDAVIEGAFEALIAAVYLDGGPESARRVIRLLFSEAVRKRLLSYSGDDLRMDYKSRLQVELQKKGPVDIRYVLLKESGPDHNKRFRVSVMSKGLVLGTGEGKTKKIAEKMAAKNALEGSNCT